MRAEARESLGRPLGWQPPGPSAVPGVVAGSRLLKRRLSRHAAPRLRHSKEGQGTRKRRTRRGELVRRGESGMGGGTGRLKASIQRPQAPPVLKPTETAH